MELNSKVAIVTGAAQGIGRAIATTFARAGARVVIADIVTEKGQHTAQEIRDAGGMARFSHSDVGEHASIRALVEETVREWGRLDIVVNNAYHSTLKNVVDLSEEEWDRGMAVMLKSAYLFGKYAFPIMQGAGGGAFVNISSVHGLHAYPNYPVYAAAKAGLINLTRQMAVDGGPLGIRVNAICPGWIQTTPRTPEAERTVQPAYPIQRPGKPEDIAEAALFLVSARASFITGHALVVDGGLTAQLQTVSVTVGG